MYELRGLTMVVFGVMTFASVFVDRTDSKTFTIVSNTSFPCSSNTADVYEQKGIVYRELTDLEKLELLTERGGQFLPSYMGYPGSDKTSRLLGIFFPLDGLCLDSNNERKPCNIRSAKSKRRVKRQAPAAVDSSLHKEENNDEVISSEYCLNRTDEYSSSDPSYLRMCTICASTRFNPPEIWPEEMYEAACTTSSLDCLFDGAISYGKCQQTQMSATVLKTVNAACILVLSNGETIVTQDWRLDYDVLNIGCECAVRKSSRFR